MKQHPPFKRPQRGVTLIGLMLWAIVIGFGGYILIRALPTVFEYRAILRNVSRIAANPPTTVGGIRDAFDRQREVEQLIESVTGRDLEITKDGDKVVISFAYNKEIELVAPVYLLIKYQGQSK